MTKYIWVAVLGAVLVGSAAYAAVGSKILRAVPFGGVDFISGSHSIYKLSDPANGADCYVLDANIPSISCVK